jgi:hypothetical protein
MRPSKDQAPVRIGRIDEAHGIPGDEKSVLVEGLAVFSASPK